jgi:NADPH:quinone reductase-like Zn-dependent oxidoreductase
MDAALLQERGSPPTFGRFAEPCSGEGRVIVDVAVAGIDPIDIAIAAGRVAGREPPLPSVPGLEGIGTVDGRRVYFDSPIRPFGSMAERALVERNSLIAVPDGIDDALALAFGVAGLAAWLSLTWRAGLRNGESVLVLGASGVVGQLAVQAARLLGAGRVVAAARSGETLERTRLELGADATVTMDGEGDLADRFKEAGKGGFDVVLDPIWGEGAVAALGALNREGRLIQIGSAASEVAEIPARPFRNRLATIIGHINFLAPQELKEEGFQTMCRHAIAGDLTVEVESIPLREVAAAWRRQEESPHRKLVLSVASGG